MSEYAKKIQDKVLKKDKKTKEKEEQETTEPTPVNPITLLSSLLSPEEEKEDKDKVLSILFEHPDLRMISDITQNELIDLTVLLTFANDMKVPLINFFCSTRLALSFSKNRKSREEVVELYKAQTYAEMGMFQSPENGRLSRWEKIKGRMGMWPVFY